MSPDQIAWARAVAEESYDGQLIRDLCNALATAWDEGEHAGCVNHAAEEWADVRRIENPYRDKA